MSETYATADETQRYNSSVEQLSLALEKTSQRYKDQRQRLQSMESDHTTTTTTTTNNINKLKQELVGTQSVLTDIQSERHDYRQQIQELAEHVGARVAEAQAAVRSAMEEELQTSEAAVQQLQAAHQQLAQVQ